MRTFRADTSEVERVGGKYYPGRHKQPKPTKQTTIDRFAAEAAQLSRDIEKTYQRVRGERVERVKKLNSRINKLLRQRDQFEKEMEAFNVGEK